MPEAQSGTYTPSPARTAFSTLYARVLNYVFAPSDAALTTIAKECINESIQKLNSRRWTWQRQHDDLTLAAGTQEYDLTATFNAPRSVQMLNTSTEVVGKLFFVDPKSFDEYFPNRSAAGTPEAYTIYNEYANGHLTLSCTPSSGFVTTYPKLRVRYYKRAALLSGDADLFDGPTDFEPFIVWHARASLSAHMTPDKIAFADKRSQEIWRDLVREDVLKETGDW